MMPIKFSKSARIRARRSATQALYQWQMSGAPIQEIIDQFVADERQLKKADPEYFKMLLKGTIKEEKSLKAQLSPLIDRTLEQLDPVEKSILYIGLYELIYRPEMPWRAVINEAVDLAKAFGAEQSYKFVNGVLDQAALTIRAAEIQDTA